MAINSVGYDGTVDEVQWATMVSKVGGYEYGVDKAGDFAVSQSAGTRMINVAAGLAWGRGVMDISDAAAVIQLDEVTTGSRYDLIALRRTWGPANGGPTEIVVIKGTSAKSIPTGRQVNPGVIDDQPLALARVQAGSASIPEIIDLRVWGRNGGPLVAANDLARSYLGAIGTEVSIKDLLWARRLGPNNSAVWKKIGLTDDSGIVTINSGYAAGWGGPGSYIQYKVKNGVAQLMLSFKRTGTEIKSGGNIVNIKLLTLRHAIALPATYWAALHSGPTGGVASGHISRSGEVYLSSIAANSIPSGAEFTLSGTYLTQD